MKNQRLESLDFTKGVLIILMITFHLVYIGDNYPYIKKIVYAFHMPAFLIISGYFMNIEKKASRFFKGMLRFLIPYLILESGYIVMAALLPIREHINSLTPNLFIHHLLTNPLGPYWYLHTLMLCGIVYFLVFHINRLSVLSRILLTALCLYLLTLAEQLIAIPYALYFLIGVSVRHLSKGFTSVFRPSIFSIPCFLLLVIHPQNLSTNAVGSLCIIYCAISICLLLYQDNKFGKIISYLGGHSLPLYLYSPLFTFVCKPFVSFLSFDKSGLTFLLLSLTICISGSLCVHYMVNRVLKAITSLWMPYKKKSIRNEESSM